MKFLFAVYALIASTMLHADELPIELDNILKLAQEARNGANDIGFGLCTLVNSPSTCKRDFSVGQGVCALKNNPSSCNDITSLGEGLCTLKNSPSTCSSARR